MPAADIKGLHHTAYRCKDVEETRQFYEDFLGLPLVDAFEINMTITNETTPDGRETEVLHIFFEMDDGSAIAFFAEPEVAFAFKEQRDFDLHLALEVEPGKLEDMFQKGKAAGIETRGISDHGFIHSVYFRDPNGYVLELTSTCTAPVGTKPGATVEDRIAARDVLDKFAQRNAGQQAML